MVVVVVFLYLFLWVECVVGGRACWLGWSSFAGGGGLRYPNRFWRLGCRFDMRMDGSVGVPYVLYSCRCVWCGFIIIAYIQSIYGLRCFLRWLLNR
jgi:hypothetical protein